MKINYLHSCILFVLLFVSHLSSAQTNAISIKFIGNCGLYLTDGTTHIYSDFPYKSGAYGYMEFEASELDSVHENSLFIFTHKHKDHYSRKNMKYVLKNKGGKKYDKWNIAKLAKLTETIPDFKIEVFKTKHSLSFGHYSYLITWHGKKIFLSGDTESAETIATIKDIDWAFIPFWIFKDAKKKEIKIDTKVRAVYHLYPFETFEGDKPKDLVLLQTQNEVFRIPFD